METSSPPSSSEIIMLPPTPSPIPVGSAESVVDSSTMSDSTMEKMEKSGEADRPEDVTIALSLTPDPPTESDPPTRPSLTRAHFRSRSLAGVPSVPLMTRAYSSPGLDSRGRYIFVHGRGVPSGLVENPNPSTKRYLPLQLQVTPEEEIESRMAPLTISEPIAEHAELDTTMDSSASHGDLYSSPNFSHPLARLGRRRPSSPLHFHAATPNPQPASSPSSSAHSSPLVLNSRYNESYPGYSTSSASSMPSTPTSLRSRSPSISSLETIPDIPDAEAEAVEADQNESLNMGADKADEAEAAGNRRASDFSGSNSFTGLRAGSTGYGVRADKRKRWSVCGAERRQDLDLETIWED